MGVVDDIKNSFESSESSENSRSRSQDSRSSGLDDSSGFDDSKFDDTFSGNDSQPGNSLGQNSNPPQGSQGRQQSRNTSSASQGRQGAQRNNGGNNGNSRRTSRNSSPDRSGSSVPNAQAGRPQEGGSSPQLSSETERKLDNAGFESSGRQSQNQSHGFSEEPVSGQQSDMEELKSQNQQIIELLKRINQNLQGRR